MTNLSIYFEEEDMRVLEEKAKELRIPKTILARSLIVRGLRQESAK